MPWPRSPNLMLAGAATALALNFWVLDFAYPDGPESVVGPQLNEYAVATLALLGLAGAVLLLWPTVRPAADETPRPTPGPLLSTLPFVLIGAGCLAWTATSWIEGFLRVPLDPTRADMLPLIGLALDRFTAGLNPYTLYHLPWELPLSYGPWLWAAFLPPYVLHADLRLLTVFGQLFIPALAIVAAVAQARAREYAAACVLCALGAAVLFTPIFASFATFGHTPAYFPLLAAFAILLGTGHTRLAAVLLGTLVVARSLHVALAPVLLIYVWHHDRGRLLHVFLLLGLAVMLPFVPFAILDWRMVWLGMYGTYVDVVKTFVWGQTTGVLETVGLTRVLLATGLERHVELAGVVSLLTVYAGAWFALRRRPWPGPWMGLALLAMCMTTLWPVWYIFLDGFLLLIVFLLVDAVPALRTRPAAIMGATCAVAAIVTAAGLIASTGLYYTVNTVPRRSDTLNAAGDGRLRVQLPRAWRTDASLQIVAGSRDDGIIEPRALSATLNGTPLGPPQPLLAGRQNLEIFVGRELWRVGQNDLEIFVTGPGADPDPPVATVAIAPVGR